MTTWFISILLIVLVTFVIRSMYRAKKRGKNKGCGDNCGYCLNGSLCYRTEKNIQNKVEKARKENENE